MAVAQGQGGRKGQGLSVRPMALLALSAAVALHAALGWAWARQGLTGTQAVHAQVQTHAQPHAQAHMEAVLVRQPSQRRAALGQGASGSLAVPLSRPSSPAHPAASAEAGRPSDPSGEGGDPARPDGQASTEGPVTVTSSPPLSGLQWLRGRYEPSESLDPGPRPQLGWFLDEDALAPLPFGIMQVQLWVSAEGHIDRVELLRAEPPGDWALRALRPLPGTPMRPGLRDGQPVASTVVVELVSENERLR
jgi:hypothetical protein